VLKGRSLPNDLFRPAEQVALFPDIVAVGIKGNTGGAAVIDVGDKAPLANRRFQPKQLRENGLAPLV
jgi:hypothetical protein